MEIIYLLTGLVTGGLIAWLWAQYKRASVEGVSREELERHYILREFYDNLHKEFEGAQAQVIELNKKLAATEESNKYLNEKLAYQKDELKELKQQLSLEFKNLANELFDEKSKKFTEISQEKLNQLINPLKEKITDFKGKMEEAYKEESRERISLKKEIEQLFKLNQQVSEDAIKLTNALKGDTKAQGDWGEVRLEMILEKAGLVKNVHYTSQESFKDENGIEKRPDYIIYLPEEKHIILDAKVTLTAYENYFNAEKDPERQKYLKEHLQSLNQHIKSLSNKNYPQLYQIHQPDYVIMFVPIEPALTLALREDKSLFDKALEKNIVLVSTSTLLATLRTISYIWKQENQKRNVFEIARESGALYDKFVNFVEDLQQVGKQIDSAKTNYHQAMNKLVDSPKRGDTIIGRIERIKSLGANTSKSLPDSLQNRWKDDE